MHHPAPGGQGDWPIGWWPSQDQARNEAEGYAAAYAKAQRLPHTPPVISAAEPQPTATAPARGGPQLERAGQRLFLRLPSPAPAAEPETPAPTSTLSEPPERPTVFRPAGQTDLAPPGATAKVNANVAALRLLRELQAEDRPASPAEQQILARWSGWGAVPAVFDERADRFADARAELRTMLDEPHWRAAAKTTLNAHYTDAALAQTMWDVITDAGFGADGEPVRVLEPGCGAGTFLGLAPAIASSKDSALLGVELDPTTTAIAKHLYPHADIRQESFA